VALIRWPDVVLAHECEFAVGRKDAREAQLAFIEKRPPVFKGR
jgi:hypothetical protein